MAENELCQPVGSQVSGLASKATADTSTDVVGGLWPLQIGEELVRRLVLEPHSQRCNHHAVALACARHFVRCPRLHQVRVVPSVMYQVMLHEDDHVEMRVHVYMTSCEETYVHTHSMAFSSHGMFGAYEERIWRVTPAPDDVVYRFRRSKTGHLAAPAQETGSLRVFQRRYQFEGNILVVQPHEFHSVAAMPGSPPPVTLIVRNKKQRSARTEVLSATREIEAPTEPIRLATPAEVEAVCERLHYVLGEVSDRWGAVQ